MAPLASWVGLASAPVATAGHPAGQPFLGWSEWPEQETDKWPRARVADGQAAWAMAQGRDHGGQVVWVEAGQAGAPDPPWLP
jgi:hypothetical protein